MAIGPVAQGLVVAQAFSPVSRPPDLQLCLRRMRLCASGPRVVSARGNYKIVPETPGADAVLVGTITGISILPTAFTAQQQASRYTITVTANIELRDSR